MRRSVSRAVIQDAKLSFSHSSSHHPIVTRLPNHWCAISCAWTQNTFWRVASVLDGVTSSAWSLYVIAPQFSIPPLKPPGTAIDVSLGSGYFTPK